MDKGTEKKYLIDSIAFQCCIESQDENFYSLQ